MSTKRTQGQPRGSVPAWAGDTIARCLAVLAVAGVCWLIGSVLLRLGLVSFTLAVALLLTALMSPLAGRLRRTGAPPAVAALLALLLLLAVPAGIDCCCGRGSAPRSRTWRRR